jgi:hypothetical protein
MLNLVSNVLKFQLKQKELILFELYALSRPPIFLMRQIRLT